MGEPVAPVRGPLAALGWTESRAGEFRPQAVQGLVPARVMLEHKHAYLLLAECGELTGRLLGRLLQRGASALRPAVGDWVAVELLPGGTRASIHAVLPRRTSFSRRAPGEREEEQVVAANLDTVFIVAGLDADFNVRRIERYLALARAGGVEAVIVLNKSDLCADPAARLAQVQAIAGGAAAHLVSAQTGAGVDALAPYLGVGRTVALLGSSGAGKSTLLNRLFGSARQTVNTVREDDRGRHTTTRRELVALPGGALLIDTPGMRELQFWDNAGDGLRAVFPEVATWAAECRFRDCRHAAEPGCAVRAALAAGRLPPDRFASFLKLRAELEARDALAFGGDTGRGRRPGAPRVKGRRIMRG